MRHKGADKAVGVGRVVGEGGGGEADPPNPALVFVDSLIRQLVKSGMEGGLN
jgi:hypothetical protein